MKSVLADTSIFIKFCRRLPLPAEVVTALIDPGTVRCLSPISIVELFRLWKAERVPDDPDTWLQKALPFWRVLPVTVPIARQSVLFTWEHHDPADRLLAATAKIEGMELWHSDTVLKKLPGFPARYFKNVV